MLSGLKTHWWRKLLVISELHRQQSILLYSKTRSMPDRIENLPSPDTAFVCPGFAVDSKLDLVNLDGICTANPALDLTPSEADRIHAS
jgi:hypothetical protein